MNRYETSLQSFHYIKYYTMQADQMQYWQEKRVDSSRLNPPSIDSLVKFKKPFLSAYIHLYVEALPADRAGNRS